MRKKLSLLLTLALCAVCTLRVQAGEPESETFIERGRSLFDYGRWSDARHEFLRARDVLAPSDRVAAQTVDFYLAACAVELGSRDAEGALRDFEARYPGSVYANDVRFALGSFYCAAGNMEKAREAFAQTDYKALSAPRREQYDIRMGYIRFQQGDYDDALRYFRRIPSPGEYSDHALYYISYIAYVRGDNATARAGFTELSRSAAYGAEDAQGVVQRTAAMNAVRGFTKGYLVVCTYPEALAERVVDAATLQRDTIAVKLGDKISIAVLEDALADANFTRVDFVYEPGQYSVRGGIVDVFSYSESKPYRIDFFGDEVDSIRRFNISSQLSADKLDRVEIVPNLNAGEAPRVSFVQFAGSGATCWFYDADYVLRRVNDLRRKVLADMEEPGQIDRLLTSRNVLLRDMAGNSVVALRDNLPERPATVAVVFDTAPQPKFNKNFEMLADDMIRNSLRGYATWPVQVLESSAKGTARSTWKRPV